MYHATLVSFVQIKSFFSCCNLSIKCCEHDKRIHFKLSQFQAIHVFPHCYKSWYLIGINNADRAYRRYTIVNVGINVIATGCLVVQGTYSRLDCTLMTTYILNFEQFHLIDNMLQTFFLNPLLEITSTEISEIDIPECTYVIWYVIQQVVRTNFNGNFVQNSFIKFSFFPIGKKV